MTQVALSGPFSISEQLSQLTFISATPAGQLGSMQLRIQMWPSKDSDVCTSGRDDTGDLVHDLIELLRPLIANSLLDRESMPEGNQLRDRTYFLPDSEASVDHLQYYTDLYSGACPPTQRGANVLVWLEKTFGSCGGGTRVALMLP